MATDAAAATAAAWAVKGASDDQAAGAWLRVRPRIKLRKSPSTSENSQGLTEQFMQARGVAERLGDASSMSGSAAQRGGGRI